MYIAAARAGSEQTGTALEGRSMQTSWPDNNLPSSGSLLESAPGSTAALELKDEASGDLGLSNLHAEIGARRWDQVSYPTTRPMMWLRSSHF